MKELICLTDSEGRESYFAEGDKITAVTDMGMVSGIYKGVNLARICIRVSKNVEVELYPCDITSAIGEVAHADEEGR